MPSEKQTTYLRNSQKNMEIFSLTFHHPYQRGVVVRWMSRSTKTSQPQFFIKTGPLMIDKRKPGLALGGACIIRCLPPLPICKHDTQHLRNLFKHSHSGKSWYGSSRRGCGNGRIGIDHQGQTVQMSWERKYHGRIRLLGGLAWLRDL